MIDFSFRFSYHRFHFVLRIEDQRDLLRFYLMHYLLDCSCYRHRHLIEVRLSFLQRDSKLSESVEPVFAVVVLVVCVEWLIQVSVYRFERRVGEFFHLSKTILLYIIDSMRMNSPERSS